MDLNRSKVVLIGQKRTGKWLAEKLGKNDATVSRWCANVSQPSLETLSAIKGWNITFENGQIVFTDDTLDDILTILQNKRFHSELTDEDFDVESAKPLQV